MGKLILAAAIGFSGIISHAAEVPQVCSARASSFVQTSTRILPVVEGWKISAKKSSGQTSCIASKAFSNGDTGTMIYVPGGSYRGGEWFLSLGTSQRKLPRNYEGKARLLMSEKEVFVGEAVEAGNSIGGKRTSSVSVLNFPKLDSAVGKLRTAEKIEVQVEIKPWKNLEVPSLKAIISALEECGAKGSDPKNREFWKDATSGCG